MRSIPLKPDHVDERGTITDMLNGVEIRHVGVITSVDGSVRGNHYHKESSQYNFLIRGRMEVVTRMPGEEPERTVVEAGEFFLTPPLEEHAMRFLEDSELLVLTTRAREEGGFEEDTVRLEEPLILNEDE